MPRTHLLNEPPDVLRRCAAAAAEDADAHVGDFFHAGSEFFGPHVEDRLSVFGPRKTRVRIDNHGQVRAFAKATDDRQHLAGPQRAVDAERVDAKTLQHGDDRFYRSAGQELPVRVVGRCHKDRQIAVFLCGKNGGLRLIGVIHCFDQNKIGSARRADADDFAEKADSAVEGKISERLQQLSAGADIECDRGVFPAGAKAGLFREVHGAFDDFTQIVRIFQSVRTERIRIENITAGPQIPAVKIQNVFFSCQIPQLRQLAAAKTSGLQNSSGSTVTEQKFFSEKMHEIAHLIDLLSFT